MRNKYICERCGAHLDPGEKCDCEKNEFVVIIPKKTKKEKAVAV